VRHLAHNQTTIISTIRKPQSFPTSLSP